MKAVNIINLFLNEFGNNDLAKINTFFLSFLFKKISYFRLLHGSDLLQGFGFLFLIFAYN